MIKELLNNVIKNKSQGYALYYQYNDTIIKECNGVLKDENSSLINFDSKFRLASVSKQFIAFGIMTLVKQKLLSYDTTILEIFSELPIYFKKITVKHLLSHTSGIYDYEDMPHHNDDPQIQDDDIITFLKKTTTTYFEPGSTYRYSNTAYILLGLIIAKITNKSIGNYLDEQIYQPLKMKDTLVNYEGITIMDNRAYGHLLVNDELVVKDQYWCSATIGDGGIYSTVNDLLKWIDYLSNNEESLKEDMLNPNILPNGTNSEYGLGIRIIDVNGKKLYYHCGDTIGTNTLLLFSNDLNIKVVFLTNLGNVDTSIIKNNIINKINRHN